MDQNTMISGAKDGYKTRYLVAISIGKGTSSSEMDCWMSRNADTQPM